jgi:hypothetical protein
MDKKNNTANQDYFWLRLFGRFYWGRGVLWKQFRLKI